MDRHYWETAGAGKTFTHPLSREWLAGIGRSARVLDYGCGYGRVMAELSECGFDSILGVDISAALIERGRRERRGLRFEVVEFPPAVRESDASFDLIVLFAVLTCVPGDEEQRELIAELSRLLAPGGHLYVSDLVLQSDERNRRRYDERGVFAADDGGIFRHHEVEHLRGLLSGFEVEAERHVEVASMNGNPAAVVQLLARG